ncbi:hypothetical protein [Paenibacillus sp. 2KB_22]|uniref:hypothetical protein n=1 Tax=Paenibacillus sp. 2KB_22 TaxID=3232978 RepID=UPI003F99F1D4
MVQQLLTYFKANPEFSIVTTIVCTAIIWLYKEFKVMIERDNQNKLVRIQKRMDSYVKVEAAIASILAQPANSGVLQNLYDKFGECSSYFSEDIRVLIRDYYTRQDAAKLVTIMSFMKIEIMKLDNQRNKIEAQDVSGDDFDSILRLYRPLKPILLIFLLFFVTLWFILLALLESSVWNRLYLGTSFITTSLSVLFLIAVVVVWMNGELYIRGKLESSFKLSMMFSPLLILIDWRLSVLSLIIQIVAGILIARNMKTRLIVV